MEKTLIIDNKEISFKANAAISYVFKSQFGRDLLTIIMPLISEILENADKIFQKGNLTEIMPSDIGALLEGVYSLELVDIYNIVWTMAKIADSEIKEPEVWYAQFDEFPIIDVASELYSILIPSLISKKKLEKMTEKMKSLKVNK